MGPLISQLATGLSFISQHLDNRSRLSAVHCTGHSRAATLYGRAAGGRLPHPVSSSFTLQITQATMNTDGIPSGDTQV